MSENHVATITVAELVDLPASAFIALSPNGDQCGVRLADRRLVRPWITWEIEDADGDHRDLTYEELTALGFLPGGQHQSRDRQRLSQVGMILLLSP